MDRKHQSGEITGRVNTNMRALHRIGFHSKMQAGIVRQMNTLNEVQVQQWEGQKKIVSRFESTLCGTDLLPVSKYLFNVMGKNIRPRILSAMAGAVNAHREQDKVTQELEEKQDLVTQMCEMYHTASLYHDDVTDNADMRQGQASVPADWSTKHPVLGGDFVLNSEQLIYFLQIIYSYCCFR